MGVLIIEDESQLAKNIAQVFRETANYAVDISGDGVDGLHLAKTNPYDLVVRGKGRPFRLAWSR